MGNSKFNSFTVKIVKVIVASKELTLDELLQMKMVEKVNGIMANVMANNQDWCSDHLLDIMNEILHLAATIKKSDDSG